MTNEPAKGLQSPTCRGCAEAAGMEAKTSCMTMYMGECANCLQRKGVSTVDDWKKPGTRTHPMDWD